MRTLLAVLCIGVSWTSVAAEAPTDGEPNDIGSERIIQTGCDFKVGDERHYELKWRTKAVYDLSFSQKSVELPSKQSGWAVQAQLKVSDSTGESITITTRFSGFDSGEAPSDDVMMDRSILAAQQPVTFRFDHASSAVQLLDSEAYLAETQAIYLASMVDRVGPHVAPEDLIPGGWDDIVGAILTARLVSIFAGSCQSVALGETETQGEFDAASATDGQAPPTSAAKTSTKLRFEQNPDKSVVFTTLVKTEMELEGAAVPAGRASLTSDTEFTSTITPSGWSSGWTQTSKTLHPIMSVDWEFTGVLVTEP